jgi:hypothetical protein
VAAFALTLALVGIAAFQIRQEIYRTLPVVAIGILLGATYLWRGGTLPNWVYRLSTRRGRQTLTADDDPANLPARVFLPILLGVILLAAMLFFLFLE